MKKQVKFVEKTPAELTISPEQFKKMILDKIGRNAKYSANVRKKTARLVKEW